MVIDLVMVTLPKPPGSRVLMMPLGAVLLIAPANVLHGAVREHGLASSPTGDPGPRGLCADGASHQECDEGDQDAGGAMHGGASGV